jgi:hypothetical protein
MAAPQLEPSFDEKSHTYTLGDRKIPSVTQILSWGRDLSRIPAWTAQRGTALHLAAEYDDVGDLDESSVDPLVMPHLTAYRAWREEHKPQYIATEVRVVGNLDGLLYAGTIDRVGMVDGYLAIIDIKSGAPRPAEHGAQLAAYAHAWVKLGTTPKLQLATRLGLYVGKDATWAVKHYDSSAYLDTFRAALRRYYEENE